MFCLRSWIPVLFFLTHASPIYLVLFISATYFLNRPCVYCSLLLFILVVALFDFQTPWFEFESPISGTTEIALNGSTPYGNTIFETAGVFVSAANQTAQAVIKAAAEGIKEKFSNDGNTGASASSASYEWVKGIWSKKELRIQCLDVLVRL
ncbi:hypothetical protein BU24DRAFT_202032 [Aaosphaeria arxii CBS 175.79]|uniref:Uncharacterized protein n=1 Tax=Aaosphaeria arxii CBS 175.79 TaxID=1450172 RepID=A0A6A5XU48_9PLEO|nr:uncharacterized protein BU24DRAFT_202032 [Aaosphaeria arxii CBS 175.79]KAF2016446.1 hypothetical protein BU24DRAFT_202032 [Aaosphaeria arxii CBS 175.79]